MALILIFEVASQKSAVFSFTGVYKNFHKHFWRIWIWLLSNYDFFLRVSELNRKLGELCLNGWTHPDIAFHTRLSHNCKVKWISFSKWFIYKGPDLDDYIFKLKNVACSPWCSNITSSSFGYILQNDLPNSSPSFIAQRTLMKRFID